MNEKVVEMKGYPYIKLDDVERKAAESLVKKGLAQYISGEYYLTEMGWNVFEEMKNKGMVK